MKNFLIIILLVIAFSSCRKPGKIKIQNQVSNTELTDIRWGEVVLSSDLLPGQTSSEAEIYNSDIKLPAENPISFLIRKNGKVVYLVTEEVYRLDKDDDLFIIINDSTTISEF